MRATGCRCHDGRGLFDNNCAMQWHTDKHKYYVPLATHEIDELAVEKVYIRSHGLYLLLPKSGNLVTVDVYWDNYNHPETRTILSVCAWCYCELFMEGLFLCIEEDITTRYNIEQQKVPRSCLNH